VELGVLPADEQFTGWMVSVLADIRKVH
jgi:hypothetical protein